MNDRSIRVWRENGEYHAWHVSVGDLAPLQQLGNDRFLGGLGIDEALGVVTMAMLSPGSMGMQRKFTEPPLGTGFDLILEIRPRGFGTEFDVVGRDWICEHLTYSEALAMFVKFTFGCKWGGFRVEKAPQFALQRVEGYPPPGSFEWLKDVAFHLDMQRDSMRCD